MLQCHRFLLYLWFHVLLYLFHSWSTKRLRKSPRWHLEVQRLGTTEGFRLCPKSSPVFMGNFSHSSKLSGHSCLRRHLNHEREIPATHGWPAGPAGVWRHRLLKIRSLSTFQPNLSGVESLQPRSLPLGGSKNVFKRLHFKNTEPVVLILYVTSLTLFSIKHSRATWLGHCEFLLMAKWERLL